MLPLDVGIKDCQLFRQRKTFKQRVIISHYNNQSIALTYWVRMSVRQNTHPLYVTLNRHTGTRSVSRSEHRHRFTRLESITKELAIVFYPTRVIHPPTGDTRSFTYTRVTCNDDTRCRRLELSADDNGATLSLVTLPRLLFAPVYVGHSLFPVPACFHLVILALFWLSTSLPSLYRFFPHSTSFSISFHPTLREDLAIVLSAKIRGPFRSS